MTVRILSIRVRKENEPYVLVSSGQGHTGEITACPHGMNDRNGVTFTFEVNGTYAELNNQTQMYYRAYTQDKWSPAVRNAQLVGELANAEIEFATHSWMQSSDTFDTSGELTLYFPEKLAGANVAVCFGITEAEANAALTPGVDKELQKRVVYLEVESSVDNAPLIHDVHWSAGEEVVFGEETADREEICPNEDAFLHVHTRGLFGKRVAVELYGRSASREQDSKSNNDRPSLGQILHVIASFSPNYMLIKGGISLIKRKKSRKTDTDATGGSNADAAGTSTATDDAILLKRRDYTVKENTLSIAFPMDEAVRIFYPHGLDDADELHLEARVRIIEGGNAEAAPVVSNQLTVLGEIAEEPSKAATGTMKYVIGDPETRPPGVEQPPSDPLPVDLDIHVGTLSFLSGEGTESTQVISSRLYDNTYSENASTYFTYPMTTYELRLQDFIDAGFVEREQVVTVTTDNEGNQTEELNAANIYSVEYVSGGNTTTINGFTASFRRRVQQQISTNAANGGSNATTGLDYAKVRKLLEIAKTKGRTPFDTRNMCRSAWQLQSPTLDSNNSRDKKRHKAFPFRYSTNQECPPGAFYLIPPKGGTFLIYVGDNPDNDVIRSWTTTTRVSNHNERAIIQKPDENYFDYEPDRSESDRKYIALHRGQSRWSIGCITLDVPWDSSGENVERQLFNHIFSGSNGEFEEMDTRDPSAGRPRKGGAALKLHILMVEERDADHRDDVSQENFHALNRYKGL